MQQEAEILREAFLSFDHAAGHLEGTYRQLMERVQNLDVELRTVNLALEAKLQENEGLRKHLELILESLGVGVIVADNIGRVTVVNRAAQEMIGLTKEAMVHHPMSQVWEHSGLPPVPFSSSEHQGRVLTCSEAILGSTEEDSCGTVRMIQDVTPLSRLKDQLNRQTRLAAMGEMIGRIAHEIRNPLGSIELFASLLGNGSNDEAERQVLAEHISTSVGVLDQLVSNLLVVTGPPRPRIQEVGLQTLINEVIPSVMQPIRERSITLRQDIRLDAPTIGVDRSLVRQVLVNVVLNAIQASPTGGMVELAAWMEPGGGAVPLGVQPGASSDHTPVVVVTIRDEGVGIASEDVSRIFDPFFSRREGGTGLGLAIVHQVMEAHKGWVDVVSQQGEGTTMSLYFPLGRNT